MRRGFGPSELVALSVSLTRAAAGADLRLPGIPGGNGVRAGWQVPLGTIILGALLLRWGACGERLDASERRWRALVANVPGAVMQIIVEPAGTMSFTFDTAEGARIFGEGALGPTPDATRILS